MLDANDTEYYNVQGTMLIDPAISPDVALVESKYPGFPNLSIRHSLAWSPLTEDVSKHLPSHCHRSVVFNFQLS